MKVVNVIGIDERSVPGPVYKFVDHKTYTKRKIQYFDFDNFQFSNSSLISFMVILFNKYYTDL